MSHHEDRAKVLAAFGGKKGLIDSGVPALIFLIIFNIRKDLQEALIASLGVSAVITIIRLATKSTIQHAMSGLIGTLVCAWFANRSGEAVDLFIPKLLTNLGYGTVYLLSILLRWPLLGVLLGPILGEMFAWRKDPARRAAYTRATWLWVGMFFTRIAVQYPIYRSGNLNLLGTVNLAMGYPLFIATAYGSWMILKSVPSTKNEESA